MADDAGSLIRSLVEDARAAPERAPALSEREIWDRPGPTIWQAERFEGTPSFYPVYRHGDLYSYSPLSLILRKGVLRVDRAIAARVERPEGWRHCPADGTVDREVRPVGGPLRPRFEIKDRQAYVEAIAEALRSDVEHVETRNPGFTNVILCAGKDSLTLLLLPWRNPVVALSAPPNLELVRVFVRENGLSVPVRALADERSDLLDAEILVNACRNDLLHCRWAPELRELAAEYDRRVIFWKGQLGEQLMTLYWKRYVDAHLPARKYPVQAPWLFGLTRLTGGRGEYKIRAALEALGITQRHVFRTFWRRGAMWQGAHNSILRQLTGALVLSGYHGPAMTEVFSRVHLRGAVDRDLRPRVGEALAGRPVRYPERNPGPPLSQIRAGCSHLEPFLRRIEAAGVRVEWD